VNYWEKQQENNAKSPRKIFGDCNSKLNCRFFHPDFTVGFGFAPNQRISAVEDLWLTPITSGVDFHHP
jgi:hypothetical protein